jgi:hypothetical protein
MPKLTQYSRQVSPSQIVRVQQATAADFNTSRGAPTSSGLVEAGRSISQFGADMLKKREAAEALSYEKDLVELKVEMAQIAQDESDRSGEDPEGLTDRVVQQYEARAGRLAEKHSGASERNSGRFAVASARLKADVTLGAMGVEAKARAKKVARDGEAALSGLVNSVLATPTPEAYDAAINQGDGVLDALEGAGGDRGALEAGFVSDASLALIRGRLGHTATEGGARDILNELREDDKWASRMDKQDYQAAVLLAERQIDANRIERARVAREARQAEKDLRNARASDYFNRIYGDDPTQRPSTAEILADDALSGDIRTTAFLLGKIDEQNENKLRNETNPVIYKQVQSAIYRGDVESPLDIFTLYGAGLARDDVNFLVNVLETKQKLDRGEGSDRDRTKMSALDQMDRFLAGFKSSITSSTLTITDHGGDQRFYQFDRMVRGKVLAEIEKEDGDPSALFNPESKSYIGKLLPAFRKTPKELMEGQAGTMKFGVPLVPPILPTRPVPKRKLGETVEEYRKRVGAAVQ